MQSAPHSAAVFQRLKGFLKSLWERYDRFASAKPPSSCCITGVAIQMEEKAEAERRARQSAVT